jgi:putative ABC transport system ATP-binding protein
MNKKTIIKLSNLSFSYTQGKSLFDSTSIAFQKGEFYLIQGLSGAGKSTLLRLINRLEEPINGEIIYNGKSLDLYHAPYLRKKILYIQQIPTVITGTVKENLLLPFTFHSNHDLDKPDDEKLFNLLQTYYLRGVDLNQQAENLSVGQLQRVCLIRGLLLFPEVILLDEPTSALDEESSGVVESKAEEFCKDHQKTVLMVSHRPFKPKDIQPVIVRIADGKIREIR